MPYIPKKDREWVFSRDFLMIDGYDLATLQVNLLQGLKDPEVGFNHANVPLKQFINRTSRYHKIRTADFEALLYASNLLHEQGKFWHWEGLSFKDMIKSFEEEYGVTFDYVYNYLTKKPN